MTIKGSKKSNIQGTNLTTIPIPISHSHCHTVLTIFSKVLLSIIVVGRAFPYEVLLPYESQHKTLQYVSTYTASRE